MGLSITALAVDWSRLEGIPADERLERLYEDSFLEVGEEVEEGWAWPASTGEPWCAVYEFAGTLGSYKPHFWAAEAWDDVREFADPALRDALDGFLRPLGLVREEEPDDTEPDTGLFPGDAEPWRPELLLACPPGTVTELVRRWARAAPLLDGLREPFGVHAARGPGKWISDYDEFATLLRGWGEVMETTGRRAWGVIGLPC
ncbi:hypothetical protein [Streptomyces avermitilis]|uniref:DUF1877 family protein n=1 Tax=Streptomyces avermitilis TaxID=33903 RepID=A0A4D4M7T7_STRAX|nr:hypothetical protein [Streptomyces avermitilis]BBJ55928.1 hypothetical protein SAVMC3_85570 [Streptomyces avermitilis]GDY67878.1 hypothetical protein SAV14893_072710 [Streptomyces avermitilis]GDY71799.1 hypothetical protein SAV31267_012840 [Streptomyces avermitilis]GDY80978.1 hypothetical protein SAVCW2_01770 [Streptomyces avermitilis]